ncbi:MAG TPA: S9 family peptidase [Ignavibacteria bacterium]
MTSEQKPKQYRIEQFFAIRTLSGFSLSPNGKTIAYIVNTDGMPNIWTIPIEGGWTSQITLQENAVKGLLYSPKKNDIVFISDFQGDENMQLYLVSDKGGEVELLTPGHKGSQVQLTDWNKKGDKIIYSSNKRDKRFFDTYVYDFKTRKEKCVYQSNDIHTYIPAGWSVDERYILFIKFYTNSNQDIFIHDTKTNVTINVTEHKGSMKNVNPQLNKKSDTLYFLSDFEREFTGIAYYKVKSGEIGWFIEEKWDITSFTFSKSEKYMLYSINEDGTTKLKLKNFKSGLTKTLKIPTGNLLAYDFTPDEKRVVFIHDGPQNPNDIYVYDIKKERSKQITYSMIGGIPKNSFVVPKKISYKSFDGLNISAFLYIPPWMKKNESNPAILWPHGGPEWQEKNIFNKYFQLLVNRGYIVITPNFRGSTGYGKTFQSLIYKDWGGNEFKDVLGAYNNLIGTGYVDKSRIAVVGGSFGGFMTLTCVTKAPDNWRCAVDIFGPSNLFTFQKSVPEHWKPGVVELVGDPEKDKALLFERSPVNFVDNIKCPLFIVQGKNDPRVAQAESDQMVEKLKSQNKEAEYLVLEDEGHGFSKVSNQIKVWEMVCNFLDKHMKAV